MRINTARLRLISELDACRSDSISGIAAIKSQWCSVCELRNYTDGWGRKETWRESDDVRLYMLDPNPASIEAPETIRRIMDYLEENRISFG